MTAARHGHVAVLAALLQVGICDEVSRIRMTLA